jgi:capsule polysaccharide export protein KpsE/RkpR
VINDDNLNIQDLVITYKEYLGDQAQEIVVLKTLVRSLKEELKDLRQSLDTDKPKK